MKNMVFCATCNEHSLRKHKKTGVNDGILKSAAGATMPRCTSLLLRRAAATA